MSNTVQKAFTMSEIRDIVQEAIEQERQYTAHYTERNGEQDRHTIEIFNQRIGALNMICGQFAKEVSK